MQCPHCGSRIIQNIQLPPLFGAGQKDTRDGGGKCWSCGLERKPGETWNSAHLKIIETEVERRASNQCRKQSTSR